MISSFIDRYRRHILFELDSIPKDRRLIDIGAGSRWSQSLGFKDYAALDICGSAEFYDLNEALPERFRGGFDNLLCLNVLEYVRNPYYSIGQMLSALAPGGSALVSVPWLYPPHDIGQDRWRVSPIALREMFGLRFASVAIYCHGDIFDLPFRVLQRMICGGGAIDSSLVRGYSKVQADISKEWDGSASYFGPLVTVVRADGYIGCSS